MFLWLSRKEQKERVLEFYQELRIKVFLPWIIFGDFNDMLYSFDNRGKNAHPRALLDGFQSSIKDNALLKIDLTGDMYTWEKSRGIVGRVYEKLDRAFATAS